jgi:organic hydroperoxide reductase OsmC/OhrA
MIQSHEYPVTVIGTGPKTGKLIAKADGLPDLEVASPPEFGGPAGVWSPEHLFVAAVASCLMTTFRAVAAASGVEVVDYRDEATGRLVLDDDHLYRIDRIVLRPEVMIAEPDQVEKTYRLVDKAERACLISRSARVEILVEPRVDVAA